MRMSLVLKWRVIAPVIAMLVTGCSGGGSGNVGASGQTSQAALTGATVVISERPRINTAMTISVQARQRAQGSPEGAYTWSVLSQPPDASLVLTPVPNTAAVTMVPVVPGAYQVRVASGEEATVANFYIEPEWPFAVDKVNLYSGSFAAQTHAGKVINQVWLHSGTRSQQQLEQLVSYYPVFQVIGYDRYNGLLLQFDNTDPASLSAINRLKSEPGVASVVPRIVQGANVVEDNELTPDDGSSFGDGGDNWHLERIGAQAAWDVTTGSDDILIGISEPDPFFYIDHEDLSGRFAILTGLPDSGGSHGSSVAGAIAAVTDNGIGMSGVNWVSRMSTVDSGERSLKSLAESEKVRVINTAWALVQSAPPEGTDLGDTDVALERETYAIDRTRKYRDLMLTASNRLFVASAGNGIRNSGGIEGRYHSPAVHYAEIGMLDKVPNVLFVAAMREDGKLRGSSNYGASVDIAAPAGFKSIEGPDGYDSFGGTSAAASVVSGVASLIYSVHPNFPASTVKSILLSTATEYVTERYVDRGNDGDTEVLAEPIPIVNAAAALALAEELAAGFKARTIQSFDNPFENATTVRVRPAIDALETVSFAYSLNGVSGEANGSEVTIRIDNPTTRFVLSSDAVQFRDRQSGSISTGEFESTLQNPDIALNLFNARSTLPVASAQITIEPVLVPNARYDRVTGPGDASGQTRVYLMSGYYKVTVRAEGFEPLTRRIIVANFRGRKVADFALQPVAAGIDSCLIGRWSLDIASLQQQYSQSDTVVSGVVINDLLPDGVGTTNATLTFRQTQISGGRLIETLTITQSQFAYRWRISGGNYVQELFGHTTRISEEVRVNGVIDPLASRDSISIQEPAINEAPYSCADSRWFLDSSQPGEPATRFNRL